MEGLARFDLKLERQEKELLSQAAAIMGTTMAGFVRAAAVEKARALIEQERRIALSPEDFAAVAAALDRAFSPKKALRTAFRRVRTSVRRV